MAVSKKMQCSKCKKNLSENSFYKYHDGTTYHLCKNCLTMHMDSFEPKTFLWIIKELNFPYVKEEWDAVRDKLFERDPEKFNHTSVLGKYIAKMRLVTWKELTWQDTDPKYLKEADESERDKELDYETAKKLKNKLDNGDINKFQYETLLPTSIKYEKYINAPIEDPIGEDNFYKEDNFIQEEELYDFDAELNEQDVKYLALKWGRLYTKEEWVKLEKDYQDMKKSFDINDADTEKVIIFLCKTNLKMEEAIDSGDIDTFQKLSKVAESLRKTGNFTAAQNKDKDEKGITCIGELVALCEKKGGFIPRYATDIPQDRVDKTIKDMKTYLKNLVTQDLGFGQQIEDALKKIMIQKEIDENEEKAFTGEGEVIEDPDEIVDKDLEEFFHNLAQEKLRDELDLK